MGNNSFGTKICCRRDDVTNGLVCVCCKDIKKNKNGYVLDFVSGILCTCNEMAK